MADIAVWLSAGALLASAINIVFGYWRRRPLVPAADLEKLQRDLQEQERKLTAAAGRIAALEAHLGQAIAERDWWRDQYREAKALVDRYRPWEAESERL